MHTQPFKTIDWLNANLAHVKVLDGSWYLPAMQRNAQAEFAATHLPSAQFFDLEACSDGSQPYPHMLPNAQAFADYVGQLGLTRDDTIVIYDGAGLFSAARIWWMFHAMGHPEVFILAGGLPAWKAKHLPLSSATTATTPCHYSPATAIGFIADHAAVRAASAQKSATIIDARSPERFRGEEAEARPGLRAGHIPNSINIPFGSLIAAGKLKSADQLKSIWQKHRLDLTQPIITSCGSGVTASALFLALTTTGATDVRVYDGSWSEWGAIADAPIVTGAA